MPRTHLICEVTHEAIQDQDCLACARGWELKTDLLGVRRHCDLNYPMIQALTARSSGRERAGISITMLTHECLRQSWWQHTRPYGCRPKQLIASLHGTAVHAMFEGHQEEGALAESRLRWVLPSGRIITGQYDRHKTYNEDLHRIEDYKTKNKLFQKPPLSYVAQLNGYRYMFVHGATDIETGEQVQRPVNELMLFCITHTDALAVPCPIWPDERTLEYFETALDVFDLAREGIDPPPGKDAGTDTFCASFCPFQQECLAMGGTRWHPSDDVC